MSYDIYLLRKNSKSKFGEIPFSELPTGGTFQVGSGNISEDDLYLNITFNYSWYYYKTIDPENGIKWIFGKKAKEVVEPLEYAAKWLDEISKKEVVEKKIYGNDHEKFDEKRYNDPNDYWYTSAKNAARALRDLIRLGRMAPNFTFEIFC